ncbi:asr0837 [Nostoc sp. PCC 7120 = FACHB-418]|nr:asr0837 [Nostoc sp. PCC 7120 = FACHB-418]
MCSHQAIASNPPDTYNFHKQNNKTSALYGTDVAISSLSVQDDEIAPKYDTGACFDGSFIPGSVWYYQSYTTFILSIQLNLDR